MQKIIQSLPDSLVVGGCAVLSYGAWLIHPAAGFIVGGLLMVAGGVLSAINLSRAKASK